MVAESASREGSLSILITDDDESCRLTLRDLFEPEGFRTFQAANGREAIEIAEHELINILILDMYMPDLTGVEVLGLIRDVCRRMLPAIVISGENSRRVREAAMSADAFSFVPKPINCELLRLTVERLVARYYSG